MKKTASVRPTGSPATVMFFRLARIPRCAPSLLLHPMADAASRLPTTAKVINQWNHYYIRAEKGVVRLWVNGHEVSGGDQISPASGYLCLESEGAPVEFRNILLRKLPLK